MPQRDSVIKVLWFLAPSRTIWHCIAFNFTLMICEMSSYRLPCREWLWFWRWGTLGPDGPPWACWGWHWSFPRLHTKSHRWSQPGRISPLLPCRSGGCCGGSRAGICNPSRTAQRWGWCLWPKLNGQKTELQNIIQYLFLILRGQ